MAFFILPFIWEKFDHIRTMEVKRTQKNYLSCKWNLMQRAGFNYRKLKQCFLSKKFEVFFVCLGVVLFCFVLIVSYYGKGCVCLGIQTIIVGF